MTRAPAPRAAAALLAALALGAALPAAAPAAEDPAGAEAAWWRGLRLEDALGDLEGALAAYRAAAAAGDPARRAAAILREAGVLRRLGRPAEARASLEGLLADPALADRAAARGAATAALESLRDAEPPAPPPETPELRALREQKRSHEAELLRLRRRLDEALERSADVEPLREELRRANEELEGLRRRQRDAERAARGESGELSEREREERAREDAEARRRLSLEWTRFGREQFLAGRFEDARKFLREAMELDPENADARALHARVTAPGGDRERIARSILEVLLLEQELRADQLRAEVAALVEEGSALLEGGDPAGGLAKAEAALGRIAAQADLLDRVADLRERAAGLFDEAARRSGSPRRAPAPPAPLPEDPRWQEAVRAVLEKAGSAGESGGAILRMFPLGPILRAQREALPPAPGPGDPPRGWSLSAEVPPVGPVLRAAVLGAVEPSAWTAPGAVLEGVGATLVARAGSKTLEALEGAVARLADPPARSLLVRAVALPCEPGALVESLARAGRTLRRVREGSGAAAVLDAGAAEAILREFGGAAAPADAALRVPERRGFSLAAVRPRPGAAVEEEAPGIRLDGLSWILPDGGIAAGIVVAAVVPGPRGAAEALGVPATARQETSFGGAVSPGGALLLAGLSDPFSGEGASGHLAILVRFGDGGDAPPPSAGGGLVLPLGDLPARAPDRGGPVTGDPADPRTSRADAIRRWLERRAPAGVQVLLEGSGLRVRGPEAAAGLVAADLRRLREDGENVPVEVRAYLLDARGEAALLRGLPLLSPEPGSPLRAARLGGEERRTRRFLVEGAGGRASLGGKGAAAAGQRVAFGRLEESAGGGGKGTAAGVECGVRVWPGDLPGERWVWIDAALLGAGDPPGPAAPRTAARVALRPDEAILVVGLDNPFADADERPRLALWVEVGE